MTDPYYVVVKPDGSLMQAYVKECLVVPLFLHRDDAKEAAESADLDGYKIRKALLAPV